MELERRPPGKQELLEVDICERSAVCSEEESGVFLDSSAPSQDDTAGYPQRWPGPSESPPPGAHSTSTSTAGQEDDGARATRSSIVDCLLVELYETCGGGGRRSADSWDSSTEASGSDAFLGRSNSGSGFLQELQEKHTRRHQRNYLAQKAPAELRSIIQEVKYRTALQSAKLIRQLRRRDRLCHKLQKHYDVITACLQAVSQKRRVDTRLKFTIEPSLGKNGFQQWYDALKAVARLPTGIPKEWRKRVWLTLADQYLHSISIDWEKTLRFAFNERSNPDDDSLGIQIVKDLHRTGCSSYCGQEGEHDRVVLKRVLLAYARWNKAVGYCQGFNVLAALILEVTEGSESDALKVMIYLIDKVLPESYFANNLRALSVDMAVFRDLLRLKLPRLSQHLHHLQKAANREAGGSYEPPLTNVFTMQWFLTMFATCLPTSTVLKIWDSVFFEGSEVLFRVALAIWERLGERIEDCQSADEFYSTMGCLTQEMLEHSLLDSAELMQEVYSMAVFPFPQLAELREKYTYNITPFPTSVRSNGSRGGGVGGWESDDDAEMDEDDSMVTALGCLGPLGGLLAPELQSYQRHLKDQQGEQGNIAALSPGAVGAAAVARGGASGGGGARAEHQAAINSMMMERMTTDICALKKQYARIKRRQQQQATQLCIRTECGPAMTSGTTFLRDRAESQSESAHDKCPATRVLPSQLNPSSTVINHLLLARAPCGGGTGSSNPPQSHSQRSPTRRRSGTASTGSSGGGGGGGGGRRGGGSPWRHQVRIHRKNIAQARAQLGFGESEERKDDVEEEEEQGEGGASESERKTGENDDEEEEEEGPRSADLPPQSVEVAQLVMQLDSLDLDDQSKSREPDSAPKIPLLPPPPLPPSSSSTDRHKGEPNADVASPSADVGQTLPLSSSTDQTPPSSSTQTPPPPTPQAPPTTCASSQTPPISTSCLPSSPSLPSISSSGPAIPPSPSMPAMQQQQQQHIFTPFPSVKQPRRSAAARNLGLYGPTPRTPTLNFPQLSRNLNRSSGVGTAGRR